MILAETLKTGNEEPQYGAVTKSKEAKRVWREPKVKPSKQIEKLDVVVHTCNPSTQETVAGGSKV